MFRLLDEFEGLFRGQPYHHRRSTHGDHVAQYLFEDLWSLDRKSRLATRIDDRELVLNTKNRTRGIRHRRGDGSLGVLIPGESHAEDPEFHVGRGPIAKIVIGVEVKILAKAMIKQIDRVITDLRGQAQQFRKSGSETITVALVGINHASRYCSFEGSRQYPTDGKQNPHPIKEAKGAAERLGQVRDSYDELILLHYSATNYAPFPFGWVDLDGTRKDYAASLVRIGSAYNQRF